MRASYRDGGGATLSLSGLNVSSVTLLERMAPGNVIRRCEGKALADVLIQSVTAQQSSSASVSIITDAAALHKQKGYPFFFFKSSWNPVEEEVTESKKTCLCALG